MEMGLSIWAEYVIGSKGPLVDMYGWYFSVSVILSVVLLLVVGPVIVAFVSFA